MRDLPALFAGARVEADQVAVRRFEEQPVAVHADAAIADGAAGVRRILVVPQLAAGARVGRPDVVGRGEVEDAVHHQRRRFDGDRGSAAAASSRSAAARGEARGPGERQRVDVRGIDLGERAEAPAGVIAVVSGPGIGFRLE